MDDTTIEGGEDSATLGHWVRVDDKDYIISTLGSSGDPAIDVVLYDPDDPTLTPINLTADRAGKYALGWMGFDPAAEDGGQYTLVTVRTDDDDRTHLAVFQRESDGDWVFRYDFVAETADPALAGLDWDVASPEPFEYDGFLYIAFVVSSSPHFSDPSTGNIMLTRVESGDPTPENHHFRILNECDDLNCDPDTVPERKRVEPEVHFLPNANPVVFYSEVAVGTSDDCPNNVYKLMRALTDDLWQD